MNTADKIIIALDSPNPEHIDRIIEELSDTISIFKLGPMAFINYGPVLIHKLHQKKKTIFVDLKLHDTPRIVAEAIKNLSDLGVHYTTVHCLGGDKMLEESAKACRNSDIKLIGVTLLTSEKHFPLLTSPEASTSNIEEKRDPMATNQKTYHETNKTSEQQVVLLSKLAVEHRLNGLFTSGEHIQLLRSHLPAQMLLCAAAIRVPHFPVYRDDQIRTIALKEALSLGADFVVIGRPILQSPHPREVLQSLLQ